QGRQSIKLPLRGTVLDRHVLAFDEAILLQALAKRSQPSGLSLEHRAVEESDHRHWLLRARSDRPDGRGSGERYEVAAPHSITSSARASKVAGTSRPSDLAVLRLMTSSNLVGCCTGSSAGLAPLSMRLTETPACRYMSVMLAP